MVRERMLRWWEPSRFCVMATDGVMAIGETSWAFDHGLLFRAPCVDLLGPAGTERDLRHRWPRGKLKTAHQLARLSDDLMARITSGQLPEIGLIEEDRASSSFVR